MLDKDQIRNEARAIAREVRQQIADEGAKVLGNTLVGNAALDHLQAMLEALAHDFDFYADGDPTEKALLVTERDATRTLIMRWTRKGQTLLGTVAGETRPRFTTAVVADACRDTVGVLARRQRQ